jgi:hypothetical protein
MRRRNSMRFYGSPWLPLPLFCLIRSLRCLDYGPKLVRSLDRLVIPFLAMETSVLVRILSVSEFFILFWFLFGCWENEGQIRLYFCLFSSWEFKSSKV